ncbi:MAG: thioredoxin domain-containing protein [bacterium]|nr:thioredoxin domain-containing protein [bacterium]
MSNQLQTLRLLFFGILSVLVTHVAFAQNAVAQNAVASIEVVTVQDLQTRIERPSDTTYVVNLWATWCKPCVAELPYFERLSKEQSYSPVKVLLVSVDAKKDRETKLEPFIAKRGFTAEVLQLWPVAIDDIDSSWSGAIPATLIVKGLRKSFFEKEFTFDELKLTVEKFIGSEK